MGCLRLKGPAKALDLATLMYDTKRLANMVQEQMDLLDHHTHLWERVHRHELRERDTKHEMKRKSSAAIRPSQAELTKSSTYRAAQSRRSC